MQCRCRGNAVQGYSEEGECCVGFHSCAAGCGLSGQNPAHRGLSSVLQYDDRDEVWDLLNCYAGEWPRPTAWPRASKKKKKRDRKTKTDPSSPLPSSPLPSSPLLCLLSTFLLLLFVCFSHNSRIKVPCQHQQFPAGLFRADLVWEGEKLVQALWD